MYSSAWFLHQLVPKFLSRATAWETDRRYAGFTYTCPCNVMAPFIPLAMPVCCCGGGYSYWLSSVFCFVETSIVSPSSDVLVWWITMASYHEVLIRHVKNFSVDFSMWEYLLCSLDMMHCAWLCHIISRWCSIISLLQERLCCGFSPAASPQYRMYRSSSLRYTHLCKYILKLFHTQRIWYVVLLINN